jgi:hypothetical protein
MRLLITALLALAAQLTAQAPAESGRPEPNQPMPRSEPPIAARRARALEGAPGQGPGNQGQPPGGGAPQGPPGQPGRPELLRRLQDLEGRLQQLQARLDERLGESAPGTARRREFEGRPGARGQSGGPAGAQARRFQQMPPMMQMRLQAMQARRNFAWQRFMTGRGSFGAPPMPGPRRFGAPGFGGPGFGGPGSGGRGFGRPGFGPPRNDGGQPPPPAPPRDEPARRRRDAI